MCCGQTKSWKKRNKYNWRVGPLPTQSFEFCCPSIAMAWRLLHPTHWTDRRHVHPWWLPAIEMANPNAWQVGWWWIKLIWVKWKKWKNLRPCLISSEVRSGEVKHFNIFNEDPEETWFSVRSGEIVLAIDKIWPPNIPSTYHFLLSVQLVWQW